MNLPTRHTAGTHVCVILVAAFTLSVIHTVDAWLAGIEDPSLTVDTPITWIFYSVAFGVALLARREDRWALWTVLAYLMTILVIAIGYYPTTFGVEKQTAFGWFENDVYVGLLVTAAYVSLLRLGGDKPVPASPQELKVVAGREHDASSPTSSPSASGPALRRPALHRPALHRPAPASRVGQLSVGVKGGTAYLRPLGPDEAEPLHAVFDAMSPESRYARYLQGMSTLTPGMTRALTAVDGTEHVAWLASVDDRPAGIGRYVKVGPGTAEIAFEVADEFHGRGLGAVLVDTVTTIAAASGVRNLQATVLGSNHHSRRLLAQVGLEPTRQDGGVLEADGPFHLLERPRVDRSTVVRLALAAPLAAQPLAV